MTEIDRCPECGTVVLRPGPCRDCKSKRAPVAKVAAGDKRCEWIENGTRCHKPGSLTRNRSDGGPWYCSAHFFGKHTNPQLQRDKGLRAIAELQSFISKRRTPA